jgi:threonine dehydratase
VECSSFTLAVYLIALLGFLSALPSFYRLTIMADISSCPPINRSSVQAAHKRVEKLIHRTPTITCETLNRIASTPESKRCPRTGPNVACEPAPHSNDIQGSAAIANTSPKVKLFLKCENQQRIGAFKARGAFHALGRLIEEEGLESVRGKGVTTHSSGTLTFRQATPQRSTNCYSQGTMRKL